MFHQSHSAILRPTLLIVVANNILVVWVGIFCQESLDEFPSFISSKLEQNIEVINISQVESDRMLNFQLNTLINHELIFIEWRPCHLISSIEPHDQQINDQPIKLEDKRCKLQPHDHTKEVCMIHIFEIDNHIVLGCHIVCNVVIHNQPQQSV